MRLPVSLRVGMRARGGGENRRLRRWESFCARFGLQVPILLAPMAGACPPALSIAVSRAGGLGACGALLLEPDEIRNWARTVRAGSNGAFQMNLWVPDPAPARDAAHEAEVRSFLGQWGPEVAENAGDVAPVDFRAQCEALLEVAPPVVSSIMGVYPPAVAAGFKQRGMVWFATVTTVAEAREAEAAGADVVVAQGAEAGGHRGAFEAGRAEAGQVGLFALLPAVVDAVRVPVVATGGVGDGRGVAAALALGASAAQVGTGFLRTPEAGTHPAWAEALGRAWPEDTAVTRAFSGRAGRSLATTYARAAADGPSPAPYPVQRGFSAGMRAAAVREGDVGRMQAWAGQSARLARAEPAGDVVRRLWAEAQTLLG